jgi:hypothetical protein
MAQDDRQLSIVRKDLSGGSNTRLAPNNISENQATLLYNIDIGIPGETSKRPGITLLEDLGDSDSGTGAFGFEPDGGVNELIVTHGAKLEGYIGSGTFTEHKTDFTSGIETTMVKAGESGEGDVILVSNGTDNVFRMLQDHTFQDLGDTSTSPPKTTVMTYFRNRVWGLKSNLAYFSDAYPSDYSSAFDRTTNAFRMPVGTERAIIGLRDIGLIVIGQDQVWGLNPSAVPDPDTDKPEKILDIGCVAGKTACLVGDDVYFLSKDGVRGVFRTQLDKLQLGNSYPLSYQLKDEYDNIRWSVIDKACAVYFDNKYFIALPTGSSSYNNQVWIYYPATQGWTVITGWNVGAWAKVSFSGEERLYYIDSATDKVYRAWYGYSDNSTAINYQEEGRKEDLGQPLVKKVGGEVKVKAQATGNYDIAVYASFDDQDYTSLGTFNLSAGVALPEDLPFYLTGTSTAIGVFHLDSYGEWTTIKLKIQHNATNASDNIKILERQINTFQCAYYSE